MDSSEDSSEDSGEERRERWQRNRERRRQRLDRSDPAAVARFVRFVEPDADLRPLFETHIRYMRADVGRVPRVRVVPVLDLDDRVHSVPMPLAAVPLGGERLTPKTIAAFAWAVLRRTDPRADAIDAVAVGRHVFSAVNDKTNVLRLVKAPRNTVAVLRGAREEQERERVDRWQHAMIESDDSSEDWDFPKRFSFETPPTSEDETYPQFLSSGSDTNFTNHAVDQDLDLDLDLDLDQDYDRSSGDDVDDALLALPGPPLTSTPTPSPLRSQSPSARAWPELLARPSLPPTQDLSQALPTQPLSPTQDQSQDLPTQPLSPTQDLSLSPTQDLSLSPTQDLSLSPTQDLSLSPTQDLSLPPTQDRSPPPLEPLSLPQGGGLTDNERWWLTRD